MTRWYEFFKFEQNMINCSSCFCLRVGFIYDADSEIIDSISTKHCATWWWFPNDMRCVHIALVWVYWSVLIYLLVNAALHCFFTIHVPQQWWVIPSCCSSFTWHRPNQAFMKPDGEVCSHERSCTYKYLRTVDSYQYSKGQHLSRNLLTTCRNDAT